MTPSQSTDDLVKRLRIWGGDCPDCEPDEDYLKAADTIERLQRELAARDKTIESLRAVAKEAYEFSPFHSSGCAGAPEYEEGAIFDNTKGCDCYLSRLRDAARSEGGKP